MQSSLGMAGKDSGVLHEYMGGHDDTLKVGSDRSFGLVFTVFFGFVAYYLKTNGGPSWLPEALKTQSWWSSAWMGASGISAAFLVVSFTAPKILHPLNVLWMKFGAILNKIVSPIVLGALFFLAITPVAVILRLQRKDLLRLRIDKNAKSYW